MKHVEAVLHLIAPGFNARAIAPRRRYNPNPLFYGAVNSSLDNHAGKTVETVEGYPRRWRVAYQGGS